MSFRFPAPKLENITVTYKHYADADIEEVASEITLMGVPLGVADWLPWVASALGVVLLVGVGLLIGKKARSASHKVADAYVLPAEVTPFTVLGLLRRIQADRRIAIPEKDRPAFEQDIAQVEQAYFSPGTNGKTAPDLEHVALRWMKAAQ